MLYDLYSVDSWKYDGCWTDNSAYCIECKVDLDDNMTTRQLLKFMRRKKWLSEYSKGRVKVNQEWDIIEICERNGRVVLRFISNDY